MKKNYVNPYILSAVSWLFVIVIYSFGWSDLYPPLSSELLWFMLSTITLTFVLGFFLSYKGAFKYRKIEYNLPQIKRWTKFYVVANVLEIIYSRQIPVLAIVQRAESGADFYGLPMIHPLIITMGVFLGLYIFHMMMSTDKKNAIKLIPYFLISFLAVFIIFGRGLMLMTIFGCATIYIMGHQIKFKTIATLTVSGLTVLYLFGVAGDIRIGEAGVRITAIGEATAKFEKSAIPNEFFWSYLYLSSPLSNLEHNLQTDKIHDVDAEVINKLVLAEIVPEFVGNKFESNKKAEPNLIIPALNVSSVYARPYTMAGWIGIWIMFFYIVFYNYLLFAIIKSSSPYFVVAVAVVNILMLGNVFDNMMNYVLSYTVFFSLFLTLKSKFRFTYGMH